MLKLRRVFLLFILIAPLSASALSLIRDSESESILAEIIAPVAKAAGLAHIKPLIVNDKDVNAFVMDGRHVFITSGLLAKFPDPEIIAGVFAHEIGHIKSGHIVRSQIQAKELALLYSGATLLGIAGSIMAGSPDLGMATAIMGTHSLERELLKYSRYHEYSADSVALSLLAKANITNRGLIKILEYFENEQRHLLINPYILSHPVSRDRLNAIKNYNNKGEVNAEFKRRLSSKLIRLNEKLTGFLEKIKVAKNLFPDSKYVEAILLHREGKSDQAIKLIDQLLVLENNPYLYELKAQFAFESGNIPNAIKFYEQKNTLKPNEPLTLLELAVCLIASDIESNIRKSLSYLHAVMLDEPENVFASRNIAIAYGKLKELGKANLWLAEEALLLGNNKEAGYFANIAIKKLKPKSVEFERAQDIIAETK